MGIPGRQVSEIIFKCGIYQLIITWEREPYLYIHVCSAQLISFDIDCFKTLLYSLSGFHRLVTKLQRVNLIILSLLTSLFFHQFLMNLFSEIGTELTRIIYGRGKKCRVEIESIGMLTPTLNVTSA